MKHKTFFWFVLPSSLAMLLFIVFPIVSVVMQSLHVAHEQVIDRGRELRRRSAAPQSTMIDQEATEALRAGRSRWAGSPG